MSNEDRQRDQQNDVSEGGYRQAIALLHQCCTEYGFLATPTEQDD